LLYDFKISKTIQCPFTDKKYQEFKEDITPWLCNHFSVRRNTIFFISNELKSQLIEGCNEVIALIQNKDFKALTNKSLELNHRYQMKMNTALYRFWVCEEDGAIIPQLIVQGFLPCLTTKIICSKSLKPLSF
jgi:hypothetical protein